MTRQQALALQHDLYIGFLDPIFQRKLNILESTHQRGSTEHVKARQKLMLSVQAKILPRYGFEGSLAGLYKMMAACGPYVEDPEFVKQGTVIYQMLGIESPAETWGKLTETLNEPPPEPPAPVPEAPVAKAKTKAKAKAAAKRGGLGGARLAGGRLRVQPSLAGHSALPLQPTGFDDCEGVEAAIGVDGPAALLVNDWRGPRPPRAKVCIAATFNQFIPQEMHYTEHGFMCSMKLSDQGWDSFQLVLDGQWERTIYPSVSEASPHRPFSVCGPDNKGHGKNWVVGKHPEDRASPGTEFLIAVPLTAKGGVKHVFWEPAS